MDLKNIKYIILSIILLILSVFGLFLIFKINPQPLGLILPNTKSVTTPTPIAEAISPTKVPEITLAPKSSPTTKLTPVPSVTAISTPIITPILAPTTNGLSFSTSEDGFSVNYSSARKLYQDKESTGNRYTFYLNSGNFSIHVSPSGTWSWTISSRTFTPDFQVAGKNTFRYDINTQTIVDLQSATKNYTLQCVHNGNATLKAECETFLQSFQLQ